MITAQERIEAMRRLMRVARTFDRWGELTPVRGAILAELEDRVARCLAGYAADGNYNRLVWVRPGETVEEFLFYAAAAQARHAEIREIRRRRAEDRWHWERHADACWLYHEHNPRRLVVADAPGRILAMAEVRRYNVLLAEHGDALASLLQVLRHR